MKDVITKDAFQFSEVHETMINLVQFKVNMTPFTPFKHFLL